MPEDTMKAVADEAKPPKNASSLDQLVVNTIRTLAMDAVQKANSGHPGAPMALAPLGYAIFDRILRYNPRNPHWANRDRFVLSNGHASMLLYSLLHLTGYDVSLEDLKNFRQWESKTPGHPEYGLTPGVETTTGPLGQGVGACVGMAIAERWLAATFNRPGHEIVNYRVYTVCGDGDLMEGISQEAASLAGHLALGNLVWIYDNNRITIEGSTDLAYSDDVARRFEGLHWQVSHVRDANDLETITQALKATEGATRPSLIILDSHIAWGSPNKQDKASAHGEPLGVDEVALTKKAYGWPEEQFYEPEEVVQHMRKAVERGAECERAWNAKVSAWAKEFPELAAQWDTMQKGELPAGWDADIPTFPADAKGVASRESSGKVENAIAKHVPWLLGGSADLAPSNKTLISGAKSFERDSYEGRNLHFGIREHVMGAVCNGLALSKLRPFGSTFLIFSDYMRGSVRLSALMDLPVIYIYTHDSIGLGEDGPTHQPIEQLMALRAMPRIIVMRPADANEVAECWRMIMKITDRPVALVLSRQNLPTLDRTKYASVEGVRRGAYVLADCQGTPEIILIATGSEVSLCVDAYEKLCAQGVKARVVSMPSWEIFEQQDRAYHEQVLPPSVRKRISVEAGTDLGWAQYVGHEGISISRTDFGASAPAKELFKEFGFSADAIVEHARKLLGK